MTGPLSKGTEDATFVFADIAGFTALTEAHGDEQAADLVEAFVAAVRAELPVCGGTHVKTIGDALMLRIPEPDGAVVFAVRLVHDLMHDHGAPAIRVGMHHGPAIDRDGDYFGATVNLAARISAVATGGEVIVSGSTAARAPAVEGVVYEPRGRHSLRNVGEPVELFAALRVGAEGTDRMAIDPVRRMAVDPQRSAGRLMHEDSAFYFCSLACAGAFAQAPERFAPSLPTS